MDVRMPDGTVITNVPDNTTQADLLARYEQHRADSTPKIKIGKEGFSDALSGVIDNTGAIGKNLASAGTALSNLWEGAKQIAGRGDDQAIQANRQIAAAAPVGAFAGNAALLAPTMMIPAANTVTGAGLVGATQALLTPTQGNESRLTNTAIGGALGSAGQYGGNKLGEFLTNRLATKTVEGSASASQNAVRDATLKAAQEAGYTVPASTVNPSWINKRLEGIAGKAALGQESAIKNQEVTNSIARKALGLADDAPLSVGALNEIRADAGKAYKAISDLPPREAEVGGALFNRAEVPRLDPKIALQELKQTRNDSQGWFNAYNVSKSPEDLAKAKSLAAKAQELESTIEGYAKEMGRNDLVPALISARKRIAQTYDLERALNKGAGDIDAPVLGRLLDKGKPLSDGLETIGQFNQAFPSVTRPGSSVPTPGVSKSEWLASALLTGLGTAAGGPAGAVTGLLPFASTPVRKMLLSKPYQALMAQPSYAPGLLTKAGGQVTPDRAALLARALLSTAQ